MSQSSSSPKTIGDRGEQFVQQYLQQQQWQILARQWHCRWGELDLVAYHPTQKILAFVEVKTRRQGSLDQQGLLAITPSKQRKTLQAALHFLREFPQYDHCGCRFDVALVTHQGDRLTLTQYLANAFEAD